MNTLATSFHIPEFLHAEVPPEHKGMSRDEVRLMVLQEDEDSAYHKRFEEIDQFLEDGDVIVLNNSRTIPPVLKGCLGKQNVEIRLSRKISTNQWEALLLGTFRQINVPIQFPEGLEATISGLGSEPPLVTLSFSKGGSSLLDYIYRYGEPVRYEYIHHPWPLETYQTVYGAIPGSVEMPSAGRAFTWDLLSKLKAKGVQTTYIQLHAGLSYYEQNRWPNPKNHPEAFNVPEETARLITQAKQNSNRVIAVGTTVVRALESAVNEHGEVKAISGITRLYIDQNHRVITVDGLLTGFHEPEASHLHMLTAFLPEKKLMKAYGEALHKGYLWHEFGDMNLILPAGNLE
ncbi:S-adenosylmethionine:tRNA ribosyltransferase-isomerase [Pontibacillus yanchengensis]|uniref:S-adenosylmethionine:tRNA ribosyltransferase-isomerase n=2 Tax=Pontibacillus yanchengensis TaxID=462910 RepID=A0ACC7VDQ0_9BACI|nr:S-adenosylmethionine:tRNA ribosyltransferase-isomerase [Pontibacillus yanchengensis]MYL32450.1 S-adenosylmethionine:tRNA ribosyltransferase-isomerase [Pontibacillus yanchengensis]MYL53031.1 S-adenosylmethionine:tRNA ribosyltransferase-isomerase [Pontibacillus yanchengensis]